MHAVGDEHLGAVQHPIRPVPHRAGAHARHVQQAVRQRLADCQTRIAAGRQLVYHAAGLDAAGRDCVKEVSMVKAYCGELVNSVLYDCVQFHGGMGYMRETPVERMSRDARVQAIGGGASEVMLEEVAKRM